MWRQFLTRQEVEDLVRTSAADEHAVRAWLAAENISDCTVQGGDLLRCSATVEQLERLFETSFHTLEKKTDSSVVSITHLGRLTVPREVCRFVIIPPTRSLTQVWGVDCGYCGSDSRIELHLVPKGHSP